MLQLLQRGGILLGGARFVELRLQEVDHLVKANIAAADSRQQFIQFIKVVARQQMFLGILQADAQMLELIVMICRPARMFLSRSCLRNQA